MQLDNETRTSGHTPSVFYHSGTTTIGDTTFACKRGIWPSAKHFFHKNVCVHDATGISYVKYSEALRILQENGCVDAKKKSLRRKEVENLFQQWAIQKQGPVMQLTASLTLPPTTSRNTVNQPPQSPATTSSKQNCTPHTSKTLQRSQKLVDQLMAASLSQEIVDAIAKKWVHRWKGCVEKVDVQGRFVARQLHGIIGLKVLYTGEGWVGDVGIVQLGQGGSKRAKSMIRILPNGSLLSLVRLTKKKNIPLLDAQQLFQRDIEKETAARTDLERQGREITGNLSNDHLYENILGLEAISEHISHTDPLGVLVKTRYLAKRAEGTLFRFIIDESTNEVLPTFTLKLYRHEALIACLGAVRGLRFMHARGMIHFDVKPDNIVTIDGIGMLSDLAMAHYVSDRFVPGGTREYIPPEFFDSPHPERYDFSMDMYEFGVVLSLVADPGVLGGNLLDINDARARHKITYVQACARIRKIQESFRQRRDSLSMLVADLIDPNPQARPTSTQTEARLAQALQDTYGDLYTQV